MKPARALGYEFESASTVDDLVSSGRRPLPLLQFTLAELWDDLRPLMKEGVARGRIDSVHTAHTPEAMRRAPRVDRHGGEVYVYRRPGLPCYVCGTAIMHGPLAGRNLYWCPTCQPVPKKRAAARRKPAARPAAAKAPK